MSDLLNFLKNNKHKDIDKDFIDTFDALLFLNPELKPGDFDYKEIIHIPGGGDSVKNHLTWGADEEDDTQTLGDLLRGNIKAKKSNKENEIEVKVTLINFILSKLIANTKRLYAANNASKNSSRYSSFGRYTNSISSNGGIKTSVDELIKQQEYIFKFIKLATPYIVINNESSRYEKVLFKETLNLTVVEALSIIGMHEYFDYEKNKEVFDNLYSVAFEKSSFSNDLLEKVCNLTTQESKSGFLKVLFKNAGLDKIIEATAKSHKSFFIYEVLKYIKENNLENKLADSQKIILLNSFVEKNVPFKLKLNEDQISDVLDMFNVNYQNILSKNFSTIINHTIFGDVLLSKINKITDTTLIYYALSVDNHNKDAGLSNLTKEILRKTDINNLDVFDKLINKIISSSGSAKEINIKKMFEFFNLDLTKEHYTRVLTKDSQLMSVIKPFFLKFKLSTELDQKLPINEKEQVKKNKL